MPRKFDARSEDYSADLGITLQGYIAQYAPDILNQTAIMQGETPVTFFAATFEPQQAKEGKYLVKNTIDWPYANRIIFLARVFLRLDDRGQRYVKRASLAHIWWRGDDIQNFRLIVEETLDYRQLNPDEKKKYRQRIMTIAKTLISRHVIATA